jgi:hypothetical protein
MMNDECSNFRLEKGAMNGKTDGTDFKIETDFFHQMHEF